jgi:hypothetical protein
MKSEGEMFNTALSAEERLKMNSLLINFNGALKQSLRSEMAEKDKEARGRETQLRTLFSLIEPPGPHNPFAFHLDCGGQTKCTVTILELQTRPGLGLNFNFETGDRDSLVYPLTCDGRTIKALTGTGEIAPEEIAKVVIERLFQDRLH